MSEAEDTVPATRRHTNAFLWLDPHCAAGRKRRLTSVWAMLGLAPRYKFYQIRVPCPVPRKHSQGADAACKAERRNRPEPRFAPPPLSPFEAQSFPCEWLALWHCTLICEAAKQSACPPANRNMLYHLEAAWLPFPSPAVYCVLTAGPVVGWPAFHRRSRSMSSDL